MDKKHTALTYTYPELVDAILTPVELFSDIYDEITNYLTNALWDTGAMLSVISPEVVKKLKLDIVDTMRIIGSIFLNNRKQKSHSYPFSGYTQNDRFLDYHGVCWSPTAFTPGWDLSDVESMGFPFLAGVGESEQITSRYQTTLYSICE
ncbi:MAG: hypothetical protein LBC80_09030 [Treponema sp.]|jgi:hypothetical protein|nr:hypothetical protein [Treponema sp.]